MVYMRCGHVDDLEEGRYETREIFDKVESGLRLILTPVNLRKYTTNEIQRTSVHSHFAIAPNASTASLEAPRTLSASSQNGNFSSRNRWRIGMIRAGIIPTTCLCHDLQAYPNAWPMCFSTLSFKSMTSELTTPSGRLHIFRFNSRFIVSRQPERSSV